jgi:hypothetical protein
VRTSVGDYPPRHSSDMRLAGGSDFIAVARPSPACSIRATAFLINYLQGSYDGIFQIPLAATAVAPSYN